LVENFLYLINIEILPEAPMDAYKVKVKV